MRKLILTALLLTIVTPCLMAQRKEMSQARSYIKSGKDFDKAQKLMEDLLAKDSASRSDPRVYMLLYQSVRKQYDAGNEQLYLKQTYDTANFFNLTKKMFSVLETLDSIEMDMGQDKKGRPNHRRRHAEELNTYRPNLYYGGMYFIHKADYGQAYTFFDDYIDCARQPLFAEYDYLDNDSMMPYAAYWATYCGFKQKKASHTLQHAQLALCNKAKRRHTLIYVSEAYVSEKDTANYLNILYQGFKEYPQSPYFFSHLIDYYTASNQADSALHIADMALKIDSVSPLYLFAKSTVLLNMGMYGECITVSDYLIELNDTLPEPYYNAGTAYLNEILEIEQKNDSRKYRALIRNMYQKALPYMERYRLLAPEEKKKWGPALYRIYLNLNMGTQFEKVDSLLTVE